MRATGALLILLATCRPARVPESCARVVRGACLDQAAVARYCGPNARWDGACRFDPCPSGQVRDEATAECLGTGALRAIGERQHLDGLPTCREELVLRVAAGRARCDAKAAPVPRDLCPKGRALDPSAPGCVDLRADESVDAGAWTRAVIGADGGQASPWLCARVATDPNAYGLVSGATASVEIEVELVVPNNDVTLAHARTRAAEVTSGRRALPAPAESLVSHAVEAEVELFRALGGTSNAGATTTRVRCSFRAGTAPQGGPAPTL
jgi:hypothetical protein